MYMCVVKCMYTNVDTCFRTDTVIVTQPGICTVTDTGTDTDTHL